jgi:hypothetical protein
VKPLFLTLFVALLCLGCKERTSTITLYGANGEPVRHWTTKAWVQEGRGTLSWTETNGESVTVNGIYTLEESVPTK